MASNEGYEIRNEQGINQEGEKGEKSCEHADAFERGGGGTRVGAKRARGERGELGGGLECLAGKMGGF